MLTLDPLPMKEAQDFWRDKVKLSPGQFARLTDEAKTKAFAVSGIAKGDELETVFNSLQSAIDKGISFGEFKKECQTIFEKRGWTGKRAWRVDNIFRTNIQTAYNVGRYKQMMEVKESRPYWMYDAVNDSRTRPTHRALDGKIFTADHPFWDKWYPPNGFRCRCGVVTLSQREMERDGLTVETKDPTGRLIEPIDPATGQKLPARLLMPDPGFSFNPGKAKWGGMADLASDGERFRDMGGLKTWADLKGRSVSNERPADIPDFKGGTLPSKEADSFYKEEFLGLYGEEKVFKDPLSEPAILSLRSFLIDKAKGEEGGWKFGKAGHGEIIPLLGELIEAPYEIWLVPQKSEGGKVRLVKRYIGLWKTEDKDRVGGLSVFEVSKGSFQGVTAFMPMVKGEADLDYLDRQRQGALLYRKGQ